MENEECVLMFMAIRNRCLFVAHTKTMPNAKLYIFANCFRMKLQAKERKIQKKWREKKICSFDYINGMKAGQSLDDKVV